MSKATTTKTGEGAGKSESDKQKLWGGRFVGGIDPLMAKFNASIGYDKRMWSQDIRGSQAYANALQGAGIITEEENATLQEGLKAVAAEWEAGTFEIGDGDEDIHTANERRLTELVGSVGGKLHTGRSRNDQVVTDMRLWLRDEIDALLPLLGELIAVATKRAQKEVELLMCGYTHLQKAQPIRWGHFLLRHACAWKRDYERLQQVRTNLNVCPLGSGALAGNPFGVDRDALAQELDFDGVTWNSMDAVSDRDFIMEMHFWGSMMAVHLSGFAEDLIVYSSKEFGFVTMADAYSTGSSLMPQKKNADAAELLRGIAGRISGNLSGSLLFMHGLPSTYNKDMQFDKEPLFALCDDMRMMLPIATGMLSTLTANADVMEAALTSEMLATDVAEYLVRKGMPFRQAHHCVGEVVRLAEEKQCEMSALELKELQEISEVFDVDVAEVWDFERSVDLKNVQGGTSKESVLQTAERMLEWLFGHDEPAEE